MNHRSHPRFSPDTLTIAVVSFAIFLTGCAELKGRRVDEGSMCSIEAESNARLKDSDQIYVSNWLKARGTSAQELLERTRGEVRAILGDPRRGDIKPDCRPDQGLRAALARNPDDTHLAYQVKFWCEEDHAQWFYAIPRWSYLRGSTFCVIHFENGRVISVGNATSKIARRYANQEIFVKVP